MPSEPVVLYVEDDPADIELTLLSFEEAGVTNTIHIARDGAEALDFLFCRGSRASKNYVAPRLVILDLKLPKISGLEVLQVLRNNERTRQIPVVVLTSSREQTDLIDSYNLDVDSYIKKPVDFEGFTQMIRKLCSYWTMADNVSER